MEILGYYMSSLFDFIGLPHYITSIGPVATLFKANWILGETFTWQQLVGTYLILTGVVIISKGGYYKKFGVTKTNLNHPYYPSPKG